MRTQPFPHRTEAENAALDRLQNTTYATDDAPHLKTQRITMSSDYERQNVEDKSMVDAQGAAANLWWYNFNSTENRRGL